MTPQEEEALVTLITQRVIAALSKQENTAVTCDAKPKALIIGSNQNLPIDVVNHYQLYDLSAYKCEKDIETFECVYISELSNTVLADIALGRDSQPAQCAVLKALLSGKNVFMLESALSHRKFDKKKASRGLYQLYEGYFNQLQSYGVRVIRTQNFGVNQNCSAIADNALDKVITESLALQLIEKEGDVIHLRKGTVITPSARDVFNHSQKKVDFVE